MAKVSAKRKYLDGLRAGIPVIFGFIPVGIAYGIMARNAGFTAAETIFMSAAVFAGASQMMAVGMYAQGAGALTIVLATFILNLRHLIMSTCVENRLTDAGKGLRLLAAFGVTDESFAIYTTQSYEKRSVIYFLGLITVTYSSWVIGGVIGAFASNFLPVIISASFGIAMYAMFIGILVPSLTNNARLCLLVVITALCNTALVQILPSSWALVISTVVCAFAGVFFVELPVEMLEEKRDACK